MPAMVKDFFATARGSKPYSKADVLKWLRRRQPRALKKQLASSVPAPPGEIAGEGRGEASRREAPPTERRPRRSAPPPPSRPPPPRAASGRRLPRRRPRRRGEEGGPLPKGTKVTVDNGEGDGRELQPRRRPLHPADRGRVERVAPRLQENQVVGDPAWSAPSEARSCAAGGGVSAQPRILRANATVASERAFARACRGARTRQSDGRREPRERAVIHRRSAPRRGGGSVARGVVSYTCEAAATRCRRWRSSHAIVPSSSTFSAFWTCPEPRPVSLSRRRLDERRGEPRLLVLLVLLAAPRRHTSRGAPSAAPSACRRRGGGREPRESARKCSTWSPKPPIALLDRDEHLVLRRELQDQLGVQRLHEARVGDGDADLAVGRRLDCARRLDRRREPRADREDGDALLRALATPRRSRGPCRRAPPCRWRASRRGRIQSSR